MLNVCTFAGDRSAIESLTSPTTHLGDLFSSEILERLQAVHDKQIDNIIIRGLPVPQIVDETPKEIHAAVPHIFPRYLIETLGTYLGQFSEKGIESSIRFRTSEDGSMNVETWHGHPQFTYSVFYCLRGDKNAKTYFLSANDIIKDATEEDKAMLLNSGLIKQATNGYEFSEEIYQPSDFQQQIENLDLPDTTKILSGNRENEAHTYLLRRMLDAKDKVVYQPGDVAIYNERQTMRFSPSYMPSAQPGQERWLLGVGVH